MVKYLKKEEKLKRHRCVCLEVAVMLNLIPSGRPIADCQLCQGTGWVVQEKMQREVAEISICRSKEYLYGYAQGKRVISELLAVELQLKSRVVKVLVDFLKEMDDDDRRKVFFSGKYLGIVIKAIESYIANSYKGNVKRLCFDVLKELNA